MPIGPTALAAQATHPRVWAREMKGTAWPSADSRNGLPVGSTPIRISAGAKSQTAISISDSKDRASARVRARRPTEGSSRGAPGLAITEKYTMLTVIGACASRHPSAKTPAKLPFLSGLFVNSPASRAVLGSPLLGPDFDGGKRVYQRIAACGARLVRVDTGS